MPFVRPHVRPLALLIALAAMTASVTPGLAMSGYQWKKRPLVVFAPAEGAASLSQQKAIVAQFRPAFQDRKMVVVYVAGDRVSAELGPGPKSGAAALRARFGVAPGEFRAVLVGLDGGVKLSSGTPIAATTLFSTIDAMPMRKDEVKRSR